MSRAAALVMLAALATALLVGRLPQVGPALGFTAAPAKDFTVTAQPVSVAVQQGRSATFTVSVAPVEGFTGKVSLEASGLATGMTASFSPSTVTVGSATVSSTLTVTTAPSTPTGSRSFTVTGTSGSTKRTLSLTVVVSTPPAPGLAVAVTPGSITVAPGSIATYAVSVSRVNDYSGPVALGVSGSLPAGVTVALTPASIPSGSSSPVSATLTARTSETTPGSTTQLTVTATGTGLTSTVGATLVVDTNQSAKAFSLGGTAPGRLGPGVAPSPLDLAVTNPNNQPLRVTNLGVTVTGTDKAGCTAADFTVRQYSGSYPLSVPAGAQNVRLTSLGVPVSALPTVSMLDRAGNQDACKGVTLSLSYTGSATNQ